MLFFLSQPVLHVLGGALALEVELDVVQRVAYLLEGRFGIETRIAAGKQMANVTQAPPLGLLRFLRPTEALTNHLHQVV